MTITAQGLLDKARIISKEKNITVNEVIQRYFFDRIIERISLSKYKFNFILKGGVLISSFIGIDNRTTKDIDTIIKGINLTQAELLEILKEILNINCDDNIKYNVVGIKEIKEEDEYGGLRFNIKAILEKIEIPLSIDIATGDVITPSEIEYEYTTLIDHKKIKVMTYNKETIIAEKIQTIIEKGILNSRMKDYYDVYFLLKENDFNKEVLMDAINNTFKKRKVNKNNIIDRLNIIKENELLKERWQNYSKKHTFTRNISFDNIIAQIEKIKEYI